MTLAAGHWRGDMGQDNPHLRHPLEPWGAEVPDARIAVLAVHGRDQDPGFMKDLSARFRCTLARFYAARADDRSWYPRPFLEPIEANQPRLDYALAAVAAGITAIGNDGFQPGRIVLWGFSQGACLLSHFIATQQPHIAGAILFTGGYIGPDPLQVPAGAPLAGMPVIVRSVENDPWVPPGRVQATADLLRSCGAVVDVVIAPGSEHIVTEEATDAGGALLNRLCA